MRPSVSALAAFAALGFAACASQPRESPAPPKADRQKVANVSPFDVSTCWPRSLELPDPVNHEALVGYLVAHRAQVLECLVDPKARGADKRTRVAVELTVTEAGAEAKVTGDNLTSVGSACVKDVLDKAVGPKPLPKGSPPATAQPEFSHVAGISPTVTFGLNDASDVAGTIRLAQRALCPCFEDWRMAAPRILEAKVRLGAPDAGTAGSSSVQVSFEPARDAASEKVAACLKDKLAALAYPAGARPLTVPYVFVSLNSGVTDELADAPDPVRLLQLDAARNQRAADATLRRAARINAVTAYDALVARYKKKQEASLVKELELKCARLVAADDAWLRSLAQQLELDQRTLALLEAIHTQAPEDSGATDAAAKARSTVQGTQQDVDRVKKTRADDQAACPHL